MTRADLNETGLRLRAIVAMAANRCIGKDGKLPWHLPEDLKLFKERTLGHPILMGRKTCESLGRPLPRRRNLVLSSQSDCGPGFEVVKTMEDLPGLGLEGDVYLIGGAAVFEAYLTLCEDLFLSKLHESFEGDTFMEPFEDQFPQVSTLSEHEGFDLLHCQRS